MRATTVGGLPLELVQPLADLGRGGALVREARQRPELLGAAGRALGGHHHELVPAEQHLDGVEVDEFGEAVA